MTPPRYRSLISSPLGLITLVATDSHLLCAYMENQKHTEKISLSSIPLCSGHPVLQAGAKWLEDYFSGLRPDPRAIPLAPAGTSFQIKVWDALRNIPYGETVTYGQLAKALDIASAQAVGGAVGRNPLSIFIPCHRVIGAGGQLTGYAGGLQRKAWLLRHEERTGNGEG